MTDKTPAMPELPDPELGYIKTDKSNQPAFSARQMREAMQSAQPAAPQYNGWYCAHCQRGVDASEVTFHEQHTVCGRVITNDAPPALQPAAAVSDEAIYAVWTQHCQTPGTTTRQLVCGFARAILALRPAQQAVPMTDEQVKAARRSVCDDPDELPEPWAFRMGIRAAEAHHGITAHGAQEGV